MYGEEYYLFFDKNKADNSLAARQFAYRFLKQQGFLKSRNDTAFRKGIAERFCIGGLHSGELTSRTLSGEWRYEIDSRVAEWYKQFKRTYSRSPNPEEVEQIKLKFFKVMFPGTKFPPFGRKIRYPYGYEDDAMLVTAALWNSLVCGFRGGWKGENAISAEGDKADRNYIGNKWVVLIGYDESSPEVEQSSEVIPAERWSVADSGRGIAEVHFDPVIEVDRINAENAMDNLYRDMIYQAMIESPAGTVPDSTAPDTEPL